MARDIPCKPKHKKVGVTVFNIRKSMLQNKNITSDKKEVF